jgi:hypothetical protein
MHQSDDYLRQFTAFRQQLEAMARFYQHACIEQMLEQLRHEQEHFTKQPTRAQRAMYHLRRWSSQRLHALAHRIEPTAAYPQDDLADEDIAEAEFRVFEPDTAELRDELNERSRYGRWRIWGVRR